MKKKYYIILLYLIGTFISCKNGNQKVVSDTKIDGTAPKKIEVVANGSFLIDSLLHSPTFIRLETNSNCLIGNIDKLICADSLFFVVDKRIAKAVFVFDWNGRFVNKIATRGRGPGEFTEIWDVNVDTKAKTIALLDEKIRKINYYSYDCHYLDYKRIPFIFFGFQNIDDNTIAYYTNRAPNGRMPAINDNLFVIAQKNNKVKSKAFPLTENEKNNTFNFETFNAPLWKFGQRVYFNPRFSDTIYRVFPDSLKAEFVVKMDKTIPVDSWAEMDDRNFRLAKKKYNYLNGDFLDTEKLTYINMSTPTGRVHAFYSKTNKQTFSGRDFSASNPFFSYFDLPLATLSDNTFVVVSSAKNILDLKNITLVSLQHHNDDIKRELNVFDKLTDQDNPVLVLFKTR
jgi:hypothetical protein